MGAEISFHGSDYITIKHLDEARFEPTTYQL
jgi:hypothetical protein